MGTAEIGGNDFGAQRDVSQFVVTHRVKVPRSSVPRQKRELARTVTGTHACQGVPVRDFG
jgi:hypothetical protein